MSLNSEISIIVFHIVYNTWKKLDLLEGKGKKAVTINPAYENLFKVKFNDNSKNSKVKANYEQKKYCIYCIKKRREIQGFVENCLMDIFVTQQY